MVKTKNQFYICRMITKKEAFADASTEEKIKEAARKIFTQKGFAATRTRDIAEEAGINLALLNYYFRSKEKLFEIIMKENLAQFIGGISTILVDERINMDRKVEILVNNYIDMLIQNPDLPLFILNAMKLDSHKDNLFHGINKVRDTFLRELENAGKTGKIASIHPLHFVANLIGLTVFPFAASSLLTARFGDMDRSQFNELMLERKRLIPLWIGAMAKVK